MAKTEYTIKDDEARRQLIGKLLNLQADIARLIAQNYEYVPAMVHMDLGAIRDQVVELTKKVQEK
jgi:hypothetical protein